MTDETVTEVKDTKNDLVSPPETQTPPETGTALLTKSAELGKALLSEAEKKYNKHRQEIVLREVQRIMSARDEYKTKLEMAQDAVAFYERKLAALDAGEFEIAPDMRDYAGGIKFNDDELNQANY